MQAVGLVVDYEVLVRAVVWHTENGIDRAIHPTGNLDAVGLGREQFGVGTHRVGEWQRA